MVVLQATIAAAGRTRGNSSSADKLKEPSVAGTSGKATQVSKSGSNITKLAVESGAATSWAWCMLCHSVVATVSL